MKRIVQSGLSVVEWDGLRTSPGLWPTDDRASWKRYRNYSVEELKTLMDKYKLNGTTHICQVSWVTVANLR